MEVDELEGQDDGEGSAGEPPMEMELNRISTNIPDQVIYSDLFADNPKQKVIQTVVMFLDISGFTSLCEKFSASSKNGTDKLTKTLNGYMGALVQEVIRYGGDIMKYAGDAILVLWVVNGFSEMQPTVAHVLRCALVLQEKYGKWTTDVGVTLRVKLGVAAGETVINFVGNQEFCHYASAGYAITAVNAAEKFCNSGDVVISPTAWCHVCGLNIAAEKLEDNEHYRLISLEDMIEPEEKCVVKGIMQVGSDDDISIVPEEEETEAEAMERVKRTRKVTVFRKAVFETFFVTVEQALRLYLPPPVIAKIDDMQPLEYLSEMRQMTIVFINLVTTDKLEHHQILLLQSSFEVVYTHMKKNQGCLNKIFMFDKGCTFLVLFGLPGFKHENDCAHALQSAYAISSLLMEVRHVERVSIGVTTGPTFCGVVGHAQRQEYTAIGRKVNMAARLMMYYPGMVTCDTETYHHSKLPKDSFVPCEVKQMKGLVNVGTIRQFMGCHGQPDIKGTLKIQEEQHPLIGRKVQLDRFNREIEETLKSEQSRREMIVFSGDNGIGKTRLLDAVTLCAMERGIKVISTTLSLNDAKMQNKTVKNLLLNLLESVGEYCGLGDIQEKFVTLFADNKYIQSHLFLVNDLMNFNFKSKEDLCEEGTRAEKLHKVLCEIVHDVCVTEQLVIFSIDNAQFMDEESWKVINFMGEDKHSLVVATLRVFDADNSEFCQAAQETLKSERTLHIPLTGIDPSLIVNLACQRLDVKEVPERLCKFLVDKGHGNPFWVDQLLNELNISGKIVIMSDRERRKNKELPTEPMIMHGQTYGPSKGNKDGPRYRTPHRPLEDYMVCLIAPNKELNIPIPDSIKGMIQARIDRMREQDQIVLKCAAVCGTKCRVDMLESILPAKYRRGMRLSLRNLVEKDMLTCAKNKDVDIFSVKGASSTFCHCKKLTPPLKVWQVCNELRFLSGNYQETAYEMFLESSRQQLHASAAKFLEKKAKRCELCGGGDFQEFYETGLREAFSCYFDTDTEPNMTHEKSHSLTGPQIMDSVLKSASDMKDKFDSKGRRGSAILRRSSTAISGGPPSKLGLVNSFMQQPGTSLSEESETENAESAEVDRSKKCTCRDVLLYIYPELIRHWRAAGCVERTVRHLIDSGAACLETCDNDLALAHLKEAKRISKALQKKQNPFVEECTVNDEFTLSHFEMAKLSSLLGQALYAVGERKDAVPHLHSALSLLGNPQPQRRVEICNRIFQEATNQWFHKHFPSRYCNTVVDKTQKMWYGEQVRCLSLLCQEHILTKNKQHAFLFGLELLNIAEQADVTQYQMIHAYATMMQCCLLLNQKSKGLMYEEKAKTKCQLALQSANLDDWIVISQTYHTSMSLNLTWGNLEEAVASGDQARTILNTMSYIDLSFSIMPEYCHCHMLVRGFDRMESMLNELLTGRGTGRGTVEDISDTNQQAWFYNICWCLILEGGIAKIKPTKCIEFSTKMKENNQWKMDEASYYYNIVCVCLWLTRKGPGSVRQVEPWLNLLANLNTPPLDCFINCLALCRCVELHILLIVWKMTNRQGATAGNLHVVIKKAFNELEKAAVQVKSIKPRLLHLRAYYYLILTKTRQANKLLRQCVQASTSMKNTQEEAWAEQSSNIWFESANAEISDWRSKVEESKQDKSRDPLSYPLPQPILVAHRV